MSENDSGTAVEAIKFGVGQLVRIKDESSQHFGKQGIVMGWRMPGFPIVDLGDGKVTIQVVEFSDDQLDAVGVVPKRPKPYVPTSAAFNPAPVANHQPAPPSALRVIINQGGVKRVIEGPFQMCLGRKSLMILLNALKNADNDEGWTFGWIKVFEEPSVEMKPNTEPLLWGER